MTSRLARRSLTTLPDIASPPPTAAVDRIARLINDHPSPLHPLLSRHLRPPLLSPNFLESLLSRLFAGHASGLKALELFRFVLHHHPPTTTPTSLSTTLHILTRMRDFTSAFSLIDHVASHHSSLLSPRSLSVLLSRHARHHPFDATLDAFHRAERAWLAAGLQFGAAEFNALLRAFCSQSRVAEAKSLFRRLHHRFPPNSATLNTLLLGFRQSNNLVALDLFYHDMLLRGFLPDAVTYNIRIDAYCKKNRFADALHLLDEMGIKNCAPTVETITTLIHGAGIVKNPILARRLFDEIPDRGLTPDRGAYNALLGSILRSRDLEAGVRVLDEMEDKGLGIDDVTYYTLFCAFKRYGGMEDVCKLYKRMVERRFVPRPRTVMLLMKVFCENRRSDLGLEMWDYLVDMGCCPHRHALDLLVTALCCVGKVEEAYRCFRQVLDKGRLPSERGFRVLEGFLMQSTERGKLEEIGKMIKKLQTLIAS